MNAYLTDQNYISRNIVNRLVQSTVQGASGNPVALAGYTYDQCCIVPFPQQNGQNPPPPREHDEANYGQTFVYRGNVSNGGVVGSSITYSQRYTTGDVASGTAVPGGSFTASQAMATNYAAPTVITSNNLSTTLAYTGFLGVTSATGQNGDTSTIGYATFDRPSSTSTPYVVCNPNTNVCTGATTSYSYGDTGSPYNTTGVSFQGIANNALVTGGSSTVTTLDGLGRPVHAATTDSSGNTSSVDSVYGPCACSPTGKVMQVSQPYAPGGTVYWTKYTYDGIVRTLTVQSPDGASTTTYSYQGNTTTITDPAGHWKTYVTDAMNHLIQVIEPNPGGE